MIPRDGMPVGKISPQGIVRGAAPAHGAPGLPLKPPPPVAENTPTHRSHAVWKSLADLLAHIPPELASNIAHLLQQPPPPPNNINNSNQQTPSAQQAAARDHRHTVATHILRALHGHWQSRYPSSNTQNDAKRSRAMEQCQKIVQLVLRVPHEIRCAHLQAAVARHRGGGPNTHTNIPHGSTPAPLRHSPPPPVQAPPAAPVPPVVTPTVVHNNNTNIIHNHSNNSRHMQQQQMQQQQQQQHQPKMQRLFMDLMQVENCTPYIPTAEDLVVGDFCMHRYDWDAPFRHRSTSSSVASVASTTTASSYGVPPPLHQQPGHPQPMHQPPQQLQQAPRQYQPPHYG